MKKTAALLFSALLALLLPAHAAPRADVMFINVGRADAALVELSFDGDVTRRYLIDTGTKASVPRLLAVLNQRGVRRLDGVFLTHSHADHVGGLMQVLRHVETEAVYCASIGESNKKGLHKTGEAARKAGAEPVFLRAGDSVPAGRTAFKVLGPLVLNPDNDNDNSLVLRLEAGGKVFLFTGDMQFPEENTLLSAGTDVKADVLKVGNHGNPDATGEAFARAVSPALAVIPTDTLEDHNSANPRVFEALRPAAVLVTEQAAAGVLVSAENGKLTHALLSPEKLPGDVRVTADRDKQTVTVSGEADLSGWMLVAEKSGELFVFPNGAKVTNGAPVIVGGRGAYAFENADFMRRKKTEAVALYDAAGLMRDRVLIGK